MPGKEVIEAMNWKDGIAFMILGAFIWHCLFSGILALNGWKPAKRYSGSSTPEWSKHDRIRLEDIVKQGCVGSLTPQQHQHIQPPPQPPTEFCRRG